MVVGGCWVVSWVLNDGIGNMALLLCFEVVEGEKEGSCYTFLYSENPFLSALF